jgi:hypothetical protein
VGPTSHSETKSLIDLNLGYRPLYSRYPSSADIYEFITNNGNAIIEDEAQGWTLETLLIWQSHSNKG